MPWNLTRRLFSGFSNWGSDAFSDFFTGKPKGDHLASKGLLSAAAAAAKY